MTGTIIEGLHYQTGERIKVHMKEGKISKINGRYGLSNSENHSDNDPKLPWIAPGLVDLQINGFKGMDYNTLPIEQGMVNNVSQALFAEGVTSYFPTVITNSEEAIIEAMRSISLQCREHPLIGQVIGGIHLEGPFLSDKDGPRGAHNKEYIQPPDWDLFQKWQEAAEGKIKIITLSPEWSESSEFIAKCVQTGVKVSIGHTAATPEQISEAVEAGALMSTHFGNGAHLMLPRHPNYLWEQLAQDDLWSCLIADGFHLPDSVLKVAMKVKEDKAVLVSDAVYLSGLEPGEYTAHIGGRVVLTPEGRLHLAENSKLLAGSAQMLIKGIENVTKKGLTSLEKAWDMASIRPATVMDLAVKDGLAEGAPADLVLLEENSCEIDIFATYKKGQLVYGK